MCASFSSQPPRAAPEQPGTPQRAVTRYARQPKDHPLRPIQAIVDQALTALSPTFEKLYADIGRPPIIGWVISNEGLTSVGPAEGMCPFHAPRRQALRGSSLPRWSRCA
jgi:hypothetical protein